MRGDEKIEAAISRNQRGTAASADRRPQQREIGQVIDRYLGRTLKEFALVKERLEILFGIRGDRDDHAMRKGEGRRLTSRVEDLENRDLATPWITVPDSELNNGWEDYGGSFGPPRYKRNAAGQVSIVGLLINGTTAAGDAVFFLPKGFRPGSSLILSTLSSGEVITRFDIKSDGAVVLHTGNTGWFSITATFQAEDY